MKRSIAIDIISSVLLLLLLYTSISKFFEYNSFRHVLSNSPLLKPLAGTIAWLLPVFEIIVAGLLFIPATRIKGLYVSLFLILIFTIYLIYMVLLTPDLPCNCGGVLKNLSWIQHIFFNIFFVFLSLAGVLLYRKKSKILSTAPP